ncbi:hypothetical protein N7G274_006817 [Stereocaulon virgatum]|uniref:RING-type domain-containing protein n=1 Tax=Stereocaulon virgatum TaxID=373712 RepID=A0ABR4A4D8_9LECA
MPFSSLERDIEFYSSASIEERIPNRFDNETGVENDEHNEFTSSSPGVYELDASDMHEMNMTGRGPTVGTELGVEDGVDETWSTASEMSVDAVIDTLQLSMPNAIKFLSSLDFVIIDGMEEDDRQCPICTDDYLGGEDSEAPVKLDCGHVFGHICLEKWLCPYDFEPKRTCPMCRAILFDEDRYPSYDASDNSREPLAVMEETISEDDADENEEQPEAAGLLEAIASTNRLVDLHDRVRAMGLSQAIDSALAERVPAGQHPFSFSADLLFFFRHLIGPSDMGALETREVALAIRTQMGQLYVRLQDAMRARQMPTVWREDGPPLSFLLDPAAQPLLELALERMIEIEEAWT